MDIIKKTYQTKNGVVEGIQVKWETFNILLAAGSKGFLACPAIDVDVCQRYGEAGALIESTPDNPIGNLERFPNRNVTKVNEAAKALGITEGMAVTDAFELIV